MFYKSIINAVVVAVAVVAVSVLVGCNKKAQQPDIIRKDYKYQKANWEFNFHLENIGNSDKISNLVNKLIYDSRDFDEYVSKMEHSVLKDSSDPDVDNTRGSYLNAKYSIIYADEKYIVISYFYEEYYGYAAHPNHNQNCFFIDIPEERLLLINDLINPIPEKTLLDLIIKSYENDGGFGDETIRRDTIWPPDLITVGYENHSLIYLVWNTYTLLPHAFGPVEVTGSEISQHLTDKGKDIMKRLATTAPQKPAEEKPAADGAETAAQTEVPSEIDIEKLTQKGDVYYLNNAPFTGIVKKEDDGTSSETWEMKDGKFHGKYEGGFRPNVNITGTYKEGKKHGEWEEVTSPVEDEGFSTVTQQYKDGKKNGEWKYFSGHGENKQLYKTETWENDKLIKEWKKEDKDKFTDSRDGKTYKTVKIGTAVWMAENLNFAANGSKCYENNDANCAEYGRLYDWATAMKACPAGYRLPSDDEWTALVNYAGGEDKAGTKLKSAAGWNENGNGTNDFGWSALPGGYGSSDGTFYGAGYGGFWWSATEIDANYAWGRSMVYDDGYDGLVNRSDDGKTRLFSVRCVEDR